MGEGSRDRESFESLKAFEPWHILIHIPPLTTWSELEFDKRCMKEVVEELVVSTLLTVLVKEIGFGSPHVWGWTVRWKASLFKLFGSPARAGKRCWDVCFALRS